LTAGGGGNIFPIISVALSVVLHYKHTFCTRLFGFPPPIMWSDEAKLTVSRKLDRKRVCTFSFIKCSSMMSYKEQIISCLYLSMEMQLHEEGLLPIEDASLMNYI
jgi:hypothetical protein